METAYYCIVAIACLVALFNWRWGMHAGLVIDVLRDPVRKLCEGQPVTVTVAGVAVWGVVLLRALQSEQGEMRRIFQRYASLRNARVCVLLAIVPAGLLSCVLYERGYLLAAIGGVSYVLPLVGIGLGFVFARSEQAVYRLMMTYTLVNAVALVGVPLEYFHVDVPGLGGIENEWLRYRQGYTVNLISGFYRSPDIMGLHAAHVIMFAVLLAQRSPSLSVRLWLLAASWGGYCLLLCGRRKMIGIPLVFLAAHLAIGLWRGVPRVRRLFGAVAVALLVAATGSLLVWDSMIKDEYTEYASTIFTESHSRVNDLVIGGVIATLQQSGVLGAGLGTATQGRYYAGVRTEHNARGWQEDGVSRILLEFGLPGFLLMILAAALIFTSLFAALKIVPQWSSVQIMQIGTLSIVLGDLASFIVSHQQFSGDPVTALLATVFCGITLGAPRIAAIEASRVRDSALAFHSRASPSLTLNKVRQIVVE